MIAACAAQPARSVELPAASAPGPGPEMTPMPGDPHAQIQQLDDQITDELARGGVAPPAPAACSGPGCAQAMSQPFATPVAPSYDAA
ncbi:MAG TPA: hypothetical protein VH165_27785, partial [Kofleriaceae bacterium]|nr:hypothetical protein [Kofleriaceae bacterium]